MKKFLFIFIFAFVAASALPASAEAATLSKPGNNLGLIARWSFDEGAGTSVGDSSGLGNGATLIGSPSWVFGKLRNAVTFSGTGQYASTPVALPTSAYTKTAWIKLTDCTGNNNIISTAGSSSASAFWAPAAWSCKLSSGHNSSWDQVQDSVSLVAGQWYFVAVTYDSSVAGGTLSLYKDAVLVDSATSISAPVAGTVEIGAHRESNLMKGTIDDARIYSRALSSGEIMALYNQTATTKIGMRFTSGLSGSYYDGTNFNTYVATYIDPTINFNPADTVLGVNRANGGDTFSVKWTGYIKPDYTGTYTFYTSSDDGARLYVNGSTVIDSWIDQGTTEHSGTIALAAGQWYPIELDFYENSGGAAIMLSWSEASVSKQIIPAANLKPTAHEVTLNTSSADLQSSGLANGLVGLWTFDGKDTVWSSSTAGTVTDRSGQGNTGTLTNMTQAGSVVMGKMGQALSFNGSNTLVRTISSSGMSATQGSVGAWFRYIANSSTQMVFVHRGTPGGNDRVYLGVSSEGNLTVGLGNNGGINTGIPVSSQIWHHAMLTWGSGSYVVYLDGIAIKTGSYSGLSNIASCSTIGAFNDVCSGSPTIGSSPFIGSIDDVRIYNRALSAREVKQLYDMGK